jgi:predicted Zn-dependent protease
MKWQSFPVSYYLNDTVPHKLVNGITNAFDTFNDVAEFIFYQRTYQIDNASITVGFGNIDGKSNTIAMANWNPTLNPYEIDNATIKFDSNERWSYIICDECENKKYDIQEVATHEIGHLSGLAHSEDPIDTMYYKSNHGDILRRILSDGDQQAFKSVYNIQY